PSAKRIAESWPVSLSRIKLPVRRALYASANNSAMDVSASCCIARIVSINPTAAQGNQAQPARSSTARTSHALANGSHGPGDVRALLQERSHRVPQACDAGRHREHGKARGFEGD